LVMKAIYEAHHRVEFERDELLCKLKSAERQCEELRSALQSKADKNMLLDLLGELHTLGNGLKARSVRNEMEFAEWKLELDRFKTYACTLLLNKFARHEATLVLDGSAKVIQHKQQYNEEHNELLSQIEHRLEGIRALIAKVDNR
jgi:hypothetical protein